MEITIPSSNVEQAAQLMAELVRQGIIFKAQLTSDGWIIKPTGGF